MPEIVGEVCDNELILRVPLRWNIEEVQSVEDKFIPSLKVSLPENTQVVLDDGRFVLDLVLGPININLTATQG